MFSRISRHGSTNSAQFCLYKVFKIVKFIKIKDYCSGSEGLRHMREVSFK